MQLERPQSAPSQIKVGKTYLVNTLPPTPVMKKRSDDVDVENLESDASVEIR